MWIILFSQVLTLDECATIRDVIERNSKATDDEKWSNILNAEMRNVWPLGLLKGWVTGADISDDEKTLLVCCT